jgi:hypothetical protein
MLTQLRFIYNWVLMGIQWMVHWWVLIHCSWHDSSALYNWYSIVDNAIMMAKCMSLQLNVWLVCEQSCVIWTNGSGVNRMQWPDFPQNGICIHICICLQVCISKTLVWPVSLAQVLPCPQLIFPFKTWLFRIYLKF